VHECPRLSYRNRQENYTLGMVLKAYSMHEFTGLKLHKYLCDL